MNMLRILGGSSHWIWIEFHSQ